MPSSSPRKWRCEPPVSQQVVTHTRYAPIPEEVLARFARKDPPLASGPFKAAGGKLFFWPTNRKPVLIARWVGPVLFVRDVEADGWLLGPGNWTPQDALGRLENYVPLALVRLNGSPTVWRCLCARASAFWSR